MCEKDLKFTFRNKLLSGSLSLVFIGVAVSWLQELHQVFPYSGLNAKDLSRTVTLTLSSPFPTGRLPLKLKGANYLLFPFLIIADF